MYRHWGTAWYKHPQWQIACCQSGNDILCKCPETVIWASLIVYKYRLVSDRCLLPTLVKNTHVLPNLLLLKKSCTLDKWFLYVCHFLLCFTPSDLKQTSNPTTHIREQLSQCGQTIWVDIQFSLLLPLQSIFPLEKLFWSEFLAICIKNNFSNHYCIMFLTNNCEAVHLQYWQCRLLIYWLHTAFFFGTTFFF